MEFLTLESLCSEIIDCPHSTPKWLDEGIPVVRNYNLVDGHIDTSNLSYVDESTYLDRIKRAKPEEGDIIISREAPMGVVGIVPKGFKCCLGQRLVLLKVDRLKCDPQYLLYALLSNIVQVQIHRIDLTGSIVSNLNIPDMKKLLIPMVNENMDKVGGYLQSIDSKISNNNAIAQQLEAMAKTIYDYWFLQFEFPNEEGKPYRSSGGRMIWNEELQQEIPEGWTSTRLKDIIVENPKSKIKVSDVKNDGEIPFFTSGADILSTNESIVSGLNCYLNTGGNADVKYYYGEASYSTDTWCITAENETKYILPFVLNKIKPSMDKVFFQGTGLRHLQKNLLREYQFCFPDSNVVKEFSKLASDIFKKQHYLLEENKKLESLKQFLLPLLMNGQVTINEK
ncbi:restriction endonuclease subunit S [Ligilactobacillus salivarius]|uniref:Type I restriction-modification system, specificity subunit S n=1 Tax=Ligilactobacillus salivarius TaxID=1624 RepID=A0A089QJ66_9LACO|nr:restriction endonuclease subunit S [Ligilactobacillus salivarius]AIR11001.1 Type I restriction-modification system, specificity subunit S [Ligilactobacillus salivarius]